MEREAATALVLARLRIGADGRVGSVATNRPESAGPAERPDRIGQLRGSTAGVRRVRNAGDVLASNTSILGSTGRVRTGVPDGRSEYAAASALVFRVIADAIEAGRAALPITEAASAARFAEDLRQEFAFTAGVHV